MQHISRLQQPLLSVSRHARRRPPQTNPASAPMIIAVLLLALGAATAAATTAALPPSSDDTETAYTPSLAAAAAADSPSATTADTAPSSSPADGQPRDPTADSSGLPHTTILTIAGGVPLFIGLLCSIAIVGYIMGRRHESAEREEEEEEEEEQEAYGRRRIRGRKASSVTGRYELEGEEVLEMETRANCAEMDDAQRPPVEMEGRREPVELSAESWVKLLGTLR